jgi:hypothetical protein
VRHPIFRYLAPQIGLERALRLGVPPWHVPEDPPGSDEDLLAELWRTVGVPRNFEAQADHLPGPDRLPVGSLSWTDRFAVGLSTAASEAVAEAGAARPAAGPILIITDGYCDILRVGGSMPI